MPIYEYRCNACDHRFEKLRKISDEPLKDCPKCERPEVTKLVSASGFKLTGTGWYETDFKNKPKPAETKSSSDTKSTSEVKSSSNKE